MLPTSKSLLMDIGLETGVSAELGRPGLLWWPDTMITMNRDNDENDDFENFERSMILKVL